MAGLPQKEWGQGDHYKAGSCTVGRLSWKGRSEEMAGAEIILESVWFCRIVDRVHIRRLYRE